MSLARESTDPAAIESLEPRQLLAAQVLEGELQVTGTSKADQIRLFVDPRTPGQLAVVVNGKTDKFFIVTFQRVNVQAGQGNDRVLMHGPASLPTRLYGSGGNDSILSGQGVDRIYAGSGDDSVISGSGKDIIYGEAGHDTLDGDVGNDYLSGGDENDSLTGWLGRDYLYGDAGDDFIDSQDEATDRVDGGSGGDQARADTFLDRTFISIETFLL